MLRRQRCRGRHGGSGLSLLDRVRIGRKLELTAKSVARGEVQKKVADRAVRLGAGGKTGENCRRLYRAARDEAHQWYCEELAERGLNQDLPIPDKLPICLVFLFAKNTKAGSFPNDTSWINI